MFTRDDIRPLSIVAATAATAGTVFAIWAAPPDYLAEPVVHSLPQVIVADDPNLARYKQVIAEQGGPGPLYLMQARYYVPPPVSTAEPAAPDEAALLEARLAREEEAFEQRNRQWEEERVAWLESSRRQWREARPYAVAYAQSPPRERYGDEPTPPPPPIYSGQAYSGPAYYAPTYAVRADPDAAYAEADEEDRRWARPGWYEPGR